MTRVKWMVCAVGIMCLSLTGCRSDGGTWQGFLGLATEDGQVLVASQDTVAASVQASLSGLGLMASVTRDGEDLRIASKTPTGKKFTVVLTRQKTPDGERTHVRVEWENGADAETHEKIMADLKVKK
jgi:hypothetical protein